MSENSIVTYQDRVADTAALVRAVRETVMAHHTVRLNNRTYICVAGGTAVANAMGLTVREASCKFVDPTNHLPGHWHAEAEVVSAAGAVVGRGSGRVFMDEPRWGDAPLYASAAMACTRAAARALRYVLGHIYIVMELADTPYEEMAGLNDEDSPRPVANTARQAPKRADAGGGKQSATVTVTAVQEGKRGVRNGKEWVRWDITTAELGVVKTFSDTTARLAERVIKAGGAADIVYESGKYGLDLHELKPVTEQVEAVEEDTPW